MILILDELARGLLRRSLQQPMDLFFNIHKTLRQCRLSDTPAQRSYDHISHEGRVVPLAKGARAVIYLRLFAKIPGNPSLPLR